MKKLYLCATIFLLLACTAATTRPTGTPRLDVVEAKVRALEAAPESAALDLSRKDLAAQESMATSTQTIANLTLWQLVVAVIGAIAVIYTLITTRTTIKQSAEQLKHAETQLKLTQDQGRQQMRSYLSIENIKLTPSGSFSFIATADIMNRGITPALNVRWKITQDATDNLTADVPWILIAERAAPQTGGVLLAPGAKMQPDSTKKYTIQNDQEFVARTARIWLTLEVFYEDIFGAKYRRRASITFWGSAMNKSTPTVANNDEIVLLKGEAD